MDLTWTVTAPYRECPGCHHPGPPEMAAAMSIWQHPSREHFELIPHRPNCAAPYNGSLGSTTATIHFHDTAKERAA